MDIVAANVVGSWLPNGNWLQCRLLERFDQYKSYKNINGDNEEQNYYQAQYQLCWSEMAIIWTFTHPQGKNQWDNFMQAVQKQVVT